MVNMSTYWIALALIMSIGDTGHVLAKHWREVRCWELLLLGFIYVIPTTVHADDTLPYTSYHLESVHRLPGINPSWDYLTLDASRSRLFINRRTAGLTVFDVKAERVLTTIHNSTGSNATILVEEFNRGYTSNEDGSTTVFDLSTLSTITRIPFGKNADAGVYDPVTKQVIFSMSDSKALAFVDARTGHMMLTLVMPSAKLDGLVADGQGHIFVAQRDRNSLARINTRTRRYELEWSIPGCQQPTGLAFDAVHHRLFVGCRGTAPVLAVLDSDSGAVVAMHEIGRGCDGVIYDPDTQTVLTSNGVDSNIVAFHQVDPDTYTLSEATTTRPYARTMALDPSTKKLYLVTAEGTVNITQPASTSVAPFYPNEYYKNTFSILIYAKMTEEPSNMASD